MKFIVTAFVALGAVACAKPQGDERLKEKAAIEAKGTQDAADNRIREMEARLDRQQRFFQSVAGTFTGKMTISGSTYDVRFVISPTIPVYDGDRVRTIDEVTYDLTNLALNVEQTTSKPGNPPFTIGCVYTNLKPKTDSGYILASHEDCPITFVLSVGEPGAVRPGQVRQQRETTVQKVLNGQINRVDILETEMRSIHKPGTEIFTVNRAQN